MPGVKALRKIQLGKETVAGTKVNATTVWRGMGVVSDISEVSAHDEDIGVMVTPARSDIVSYRSQMEMDATAALYEQTGYILEAGVEAETPADDTNGVYIYTYNNAKAAQNSRNTYTVEGGDDQQEYEFGYGHVISLAYEGSAGEAVTNAATWEGQRLASGTFTAAQSAPTAVDTILFQNGKLYVDDVGTYPATTQLTNTWIAFSLELTTGVKGQPTGDGSLDFSFTKQIGPEGTLSLTLEHDGNAVTQFSKFQSQTVQNFRLEFTGPATAGAGATYSNKMFIIDWTGIVSEISGLDEDDGNNVIEITVPLMHNLSDDTVGRFIVVNELSALP